jgi:hypothetical protein
MMYSTYGRTGGFIFRKTAVYIGMEVFYVYRCKQSWIAYADADACKTHYTMPVYTAVFLKMNPPVRNTC